MLRVIREGQRWLTGLFVIGVGGVFVFFLGLGQPLSGPGAGSAIQVGDYQFGVRDFERERGRREAQYRQMLGDSFDAEAVANNLDNITTQVMVERAILALEAADMGLRVGNAEIERTVVGSPLFVGEGGGFDPQRYEDWTEYEYGSQRRFLQDQRLAMLSTKLLRVLQSQAYVSEGEAREAARQKLEEVRIVFTSLDKTQSPEDFEPSEEALAAFFPDREEEARVLYHQRSDQYDVPERVRARHILFRVEADADDAATAEVRTQAEAVLEKLKNGEDFEELAREHSADPGSVDAGGDLGFFGRGQMVKPFEEVAFALEPGSLSDVVKTDFGFHVIRVEERQEAVQVAFEDVQEELARDVLAGEAGGAAARATAERLAAGVREGGSLEDVARAEELTLERSGWLRRRPDGYVPGLGGAPDLMATAFSLEVGASSPEVFEVGDRIALVQVLERNDPDAEAIEKAIPEEREQLLQKKRDSQTGAWMNGRRKALIESGELAVDFESLRRG